LRGARTNTVAIQLRANGVERGPYGTNGPGGVARDGQVVASGEREVGNGHEINKLSATGESLGQFLYCMVGERDITKNKNRRKGKKMKLPATANASRTHMGEAPHTAG